MVIVKAKSPKFSGHIIQLKIKKVYKSDCARICLFEELL